MINYFFMLKYIYIYDGGKAMFTFTNDCLIGISEIDEEHKKLFELITKIDTTVKRNDDPISNAMLLINELKQYAVTHFAHEEAYMERINDPELKRQKKEHAAFIEKINSYSYADVTDASAKAIIL